MRPFKVLLFLLSVFIVLAILSLFFPKEGIRIGNSLLLRFPDLESIFTPEESKYANINEILEYHQQGIVGNFDEFMLDTIKEVPDSLHVLPDSMKTEIKKDTIKIIDSLAIKKAEKYPKILRHLEYPQDDSTVLYPFFGHLKNLKKSAELIRILHYGDSQIEGDRITSYIRNELQKQFGGTGVGMFAPVLIKGTNISMDLKLSGTWERYTIQSIKNGNIIHKRLGALMSFGRFAPITSIENTMYFGEINLRKSNITYLRTRRFKQCRVFYGYNEKPFIAELKYKDKTIDAELIAPSQKLNTLSWDIDGALDEISIDFKGEDSPDIYAVALDGHSGVAVDNIPLRGSSGVDFTKTDLVFLRSMYQKLNVKLIILEFGVNLVPYSSQDCSYYEKQFYKQLKTLKGLRSDICVIVLGVSDMSQNNKGVFETYPNIESIRQAQKNAAFKAGCAFWDMYEAMGGKNSMPSWVNANPALARPDYTHFSWKGSKIIAKMFYDALMNDYSNYLKREEIKKDEVPKN